MSVVKVVLAEGAGKWRIEDSAGNGNDGARLDDAMITLLRREFVVELGVEEAWAYLARVEEWPSWARHIRRVEVRPAGELGPGSTGRLYLNNGIKSGWPGSSAEFTVTEFNPNRNWKWVAGFLWLTCHYNHWFEAVGREADEADVGDRGRRVREVGDREGVCEGVQQEPGSGDSAAGGGDEWKRGQPLHLRAASSVTSMSRRRVADE